MNKLLCLLLYFLISNSSFAGGNPTYDVYGFVGAGIGYGSISTNVAADFGDKTATPTKFTAMANYYHRDWAIAVGGGYYMIKFENDLTGVNHYKLLTDTFYLDVVPQYRFGKRWSVGGSFQYFFGQELLIAPSSSINVNNEKTTSTLVGLVVDYDIPFKWFRMKTGVSIHKPMAIGDRDVLITMLNFQFGVPVYDSDYTPTRVVYKIKEVVKMSPKEIVELGEQVVNFDTGKHSLKPASEKFLEELAELLADNPESWEIIKIVGHTDIRGDEKKNLELSEKRAQSVKEVFLSGRVGRDRIFSFGMGESQVNVVGNTTEAHKANRRVDLQFVGHLDGDFVDEVRELIETHSRN
ncbi:MAG: OmpA family protein [Deltaproteobacteria bacterium]|nr:MAG: OmpA family protein [Deltaproteobacteria bacterium]